MGNLCGGRSSPVNYLAAQRGNASILKVSHNLKRVRQALERGNNEKEVTKAHKIDWTLGLTPDESFCVPGIVS